MARGTIYLLGENPNFTILTDQIIGSGGANAPVLIIPLKIEFSSFGRQRKNVPMKADILAVKGDLRATGQNIRCSESLNLLQYPISSTSLTFEMSLQFFVTNEIVNRIEKYRTGDIEISLSIWVQAGIYSDVIFQNGESQSFISSFDSGSGVVNFNIAQSHWVKRILPGLGHDSFRLFELPGASKIIPEEYALSLKELEAAKNYFVNGDYDKTVGHCRAALDPFKAKKDEIKSFVKSKSEFAWANDVLQATDAWLVKLVKSTSHFTSKAHHVPSVGHFDRNEAEIIMMVTTALIAYIGKIEKVGEITD